MKVMVNILAKPHPYIFFTLQLDSAWMGVFLKCTTSSLQPLLAVHLVLRPLPSSSHMAWERGYKFTNFTAVASFSGHFLAPPTRPGKEEYDPAFVSV